VLKDFEVSLWLNRAAEFVGSREFLGVVVLQLGLVAVLLALAWGLRVAGRGLIDVLAARVRRSLSSGRLANELPGLVTLAIAWLLLVVAKQVGMGFGLDLELVGIAATLTALGIVLRTITLLFRDPVFARLVALAAWIIAALDITGLLAPTAAALDSAAVTVGMMRLSLLMVVNAFLIIAVLLWAAVALTGLIGARIEHLTGVSPSVQTLARNLVKLSLIFLALLIGVNAVGIDLTALTVFSGAIGVGLGFGLQKIVSNFVSGIILLVEQSIKPGDVIEVGDTYGTVSALGARYTAVRSRAGKEYLIPNETLITNQVTNLSYSTTLLRLDARFGVDYSSDLRQVRRLAIEAAERTPRVLASPAPACHVVEIGDSSVNFVLRFWIDDPVNGIKSVIGEVYLAIWDSLHENGIEFPFPQRDIRIREVPAALQQQDPVRSAAD
jgi:small-conductance mechanosensitive channel